MPSGTVLRTLAERLWSYIPKGLPAEACWLWTGAKSRSGRRQVVYGALQEGGKGSRMWRAHRLVLMLATGEKDVPSDPGEDFLEWLNRARRFYAGQDAAHQCDTSLCCNPGHLRWELHADNLKNQRDRDRLKAQAERETAA